MIEKPLTPEQETMTIGELIDLLKHGKAVQTRIQFPEGTREGVSVTADELVK